MILHLYDYADLSHSCSYTYTLVLDFSSSNSSACIIFRGFLTSVLKVIGAYLSQSCSYTYTLVLEFSSSNSPDCVTSRGLLNRVLKVIGDQTLNFFGTVLYKTLVVKQISESIHFGSVETSVQ